MIYYLKQQKPDVFKNLIHDLGNLSPYKEWVVEVKEKTNKRSHNQNALYWKYLTILGDHFGYDKTEMHEELAARFLGMIERKTIGGRQIIEPRSTTTLNTKEFSEYLDQVTALGLQQGVQLPQPSYYGMEE